MKSFLVIKFPENFNYLHRWRDKRKKMEIDKSVNYLQMFIDF